MEIVVCIKPVPDPESRLRAHADGTRLDPEGIKWVLAGYDESAVEQALLLKETLPGSKVRAVTVGVSPRSEEVLRAALALGCDAATWVDSTGQELDPMANAEAAARAVQPLPHDLILCGKQAGDDEAGLFAGAIGEALGLPSFGHVTDLRAQVGGTSILFQRPTESGVESWEGPLPCVVGLQQAWNDPRTAKLPNILKSRKAVIDKLPWAPGETDAPRSCSAQFALPPARTGARMIEYKTPDEAAQRLVKLLREEAKVFP